MTLDETLDLSKQLLMLNPHRLISFLSQHYRNEKSLLRRFAGTGPVDQNYGKIQPGAVLSDAVRDEGLQVSFADICGLMTPQVVKRQYLFGDNEEIGFIHVEMGVISYSVQPVQVPPIRAASEAILGPGKRVSIPYEAIALNLTRALGGISGERFDAPNRTRPFMTRVIAEMAEGGNVVISRKDTPYVVEPGFLRLKYAGNTERAIPTREFYRMNIVPDAVNHTLGDRKPIRHTLSRYLPSGPAKRDVA